MSDDSASDSLKMISDDVFRILSLRVEVQNEVEIVKPVLEELEVMRLSCALGALSSVDIGDFKCDILEAHEFDVEFARFLRNDVFGRATEECDQDDSSTQLKVLSLFGKQSDVKKELAHLNCWSPECEANMRALDQGIFCVKANALKDNAQVLMVFAWLHDGLFAPQRLRECVTYVLRFLTCLTSQVVCCLSIADSVKIQEIVSGLAPSEAQNWNSYSVALRVEKQEDEKDEIWCKHERDIGIPSSAHAENRWLIKGAFPAIAALVPAPTSTRIQKSKCKFVNSEVFSHWAVEQSSKFKVRYTFNGKGFKKKCEHAILTAAGRLPRASLDAIQAEFDRRVNDADRRSKHTAEAFIEETRAQLTWASHRAFDTNVLLSSPNCNDNLQALLLRLKGEQGIWSQVGEVTRVILHLPLRLAVHMQYMYDLFAEGLDYEFETYLTKAVTTPCRVLSQGRKSKAFFSRVRNRVIHWWRPREDVFEMFRAQMAVRLDEMKQVWLSAIDTTAAVFRGKLWEKWSAPEIHAMRSECDQASADALRTAFADLKDEWESNPERSLSLRVHVSSIRKGDVACELEQVVAEKSTHRVEVAKFEVDNDSGSGVQRLGVFPLRQDRILVNAFSIQTRALLVVTTTSNATFVDRVQFPLSYYDQQVTSAEVRSFGREAARCDYRPSERTIVFLVAGDKVVLYKFNESFTVMEMICTINLNARSSLSLPVTDLVLLDNSVLCFDQSRTVQSVNIRSQQTSRKTSTFCQTDVEWNASADILALGGGLVVAKLRLKNDPAQGVFRAEMIAVSSEDNREIPAKFASPLKLLSYSGVSAQSFGEHLVVLDPQADLIHMFGVKVTVRSDSFQIRQCAGNNTLSHHRRDNGGRMGHEEHWLWTFFHLFEKFPIIESMGSGSLAFCRNAHRSPLQVVIAGALKSSKAAEMIEMYRQYLQCVMEHLRRLNKPLGDMDLAKGLTLMDVSGDKNSSQFARFADQSITGFLQNLITFVPVQICRAEANMLVVMRDGQDKSDQVESVESSQQLQSVDIARSIRFGLLSPFLESWRGRCIVVTSMGKQSTGKSYFLNHLTGSSFAIAGARCTDGAWMTVRVLPDDVLLVVLDFEGLGSFERTEQEDVFLSVLNAAISMFTIFRMEMRFDKEIDELFTKFQKGIQLIKSDPRLFRGKLCMSVKDVNPNDQNGVVNEVVAKFQKLLEANKEQNFLYDMYSGHIDINCSPPLGTSGYYQSLSHSQRYIEQKLGRDGSVGFPSGKAFLDCIRLVLAKISILDWTSLDESNQKLQLTEVRSKLPGMMRTGCLIPMDHVSDVSQIQPHMKDDLLLGENDVNLQRLCLEYSEMAEKWVALNCSVSLDGIRDRDIDLGLDCCHLGDDGLSMKAVGESLTRLFEGFLECLDAHSRGKLNTKVQADFDLFLAFVIRRRKLRILSWVKSRLGDRMPEDWQTVELQHLGRLQMLFSRCPRICNSCQLGCMQPAAHAGANEHDCGTTHRCEGHCDYCENAAVKDAVPLCAKPAGHEGYCECAKGDHTCGLACCMTSAANCEKRCVEKAGHLGQHYCAVEIHRCGLECSASCCSGRCILSVTVSHNAHKCEEVRCLEKCLMDGCTELCGEYDHFHGQTELAKSRPTGDVPRKKMKLFDSQSDTPVAHMCSKAHHCQAMCGENGNCLVQVFHKESSKVFEGKRGKFKYKYQEMNGFRKKCSATLEPGQRSHLGPHSCAATDASLGLGSEEETKESEAEDRVLHFCERRCPCCSYFCGKEYGHAGMHSTSHGNMRNTYFLADTEDIDVEDRKYTAGESGNAEMCNMYCSKMGRAHVHYLDCEQAEARKCVYVGDSTDQRRHSTRALEPKPASGMDELLHEQFWKTLGWEDPCTSAAERELFGKCAYECDASEHSDKKSFCMLPAWHKLELKPDQDDGFSYVNGHKFECAHQAESDKMHHIFVLDCSGSMSGRPWEQLVAAYREFIHNRISDGATSDLVSVVTFSNSAEVEFEAQDISAMLQAYIPYRGGGTTFSAGLRAASEVLSRNQFAIYKPVLVFFSDGQPHDPRLGDELATHIRQSFAKYDLKAFVVGYGWINLGILQHMADKLGGSYHNVLVGTELKSTFQTISASLGTRAGLALTKPLHECMCAICQLDLASDEVAALTPCGHALHAACKTELFASAREHGERLVVCPMCRKPVVL